jgi:hypothetical protein
MKNFFKKFWVGACAVGVSVLPSVAMAVQDYTDITDGITAEINAVIPAALGILALTMGIPIAIHILRKIAR